MLKEFREFAVKGNMVDMAVGIVIGTAFGAIITSLVNDIIMPYVGLMTGDVDFAQHFIVLKPGYPPPPYTTVEAAANAGAVTLNYGLFINALIYFLIIALAMFFVVRAINRLKRAEPAPPPSAKPCPFCKMEVHLDATRCPHCTSELSAA